MNMESPRNPLDSAKLDPVESDCNPNANRAPVTAPQAMVASKFEGNDAGKQTIRITWTQ